MHTKYEYSWKYYIIYKITCNNPNITEGYVGSTKDFHARQNKHKNDCGNSQVKLYKFIRENGGFQNFTMIEIERIKCNDRFESRVREQEWCDLIDSSLNSNKAMVNIKEAQKEYYEQNKEKKYIYRKTNIDEIKLKQKIYNEKNKIKWIFYFIFF